jgi:hypothetical protein
MRRRTACRLLLGLLGGVLGCSRSSPSGTPIQVPDNRFPKAGMAPKKDGKGK